MSKQIREEIEMSVFGVPGTLVRTGNDARKPGCWMNQKWVSERRAKNMQGENLLVHAEIRFDDNCGNGHNSFAITGFGWNDRYKSRDYDFCGCIHEIIEFVFPELKHLIKWHLVDTRGPMHYVANTVYHASNLHNGKAKGEPNQWENRIKFADFPITLGLGTSFITWLVEQRKVGAPLIIKTVPRVKREASDRQYDPEFTFDGWDKTWGGAPFKSLQQAIEVQQALLLHKWEVVTQVTGYSPGKERNLDAARSCANWPEATDEQLCLPADELTKLLEARLPPLLTEFRADVEAAGFLWERPE